MPSLSGQTFLNQKSNSLGIVRLGAGNNLKDGNEGARYKNVIGSYLHGSILPKNPTLADFLLTTAVIKKYGVFHGDLIDDSYAHLARKTAAKRPR